MNLSDQFLLFRIDETRYAIHLQTVVRVVNAVEITPLPEGPEIVTGVINVHGQAIPIVNIRRKFRLRQRALNLDDHIVIVKGSKWTVAFAVDGVEGVIERRCDEITPAETILPDLVYTEGVIRLYDDIVFLHDIEKALSLEEMDKAVAVIEDG